MWDNPSLRCLPAIAFLYLLSLICSQETGFPGAPQNLKCVTHDLNRTICSWDAASSASHGLTYKICYVNREPSSSECIETEEKRVDVPVTTGSTNIVITTLNASGTPLASETFVLPMENVSFIPFTPQILSLSPDFSTYTLHLKWNDTGSVFQYDLDAHWQIQILHKETMETVTLVNYDSKLTSKDTILSWNWTSDMPLECTSHSVKIRCYINESFFAGRKEWSEWSPIKTVPGKDVDPGNAVVFPEDKVVPVGSNMTFCCLYNEEECIRCMKYGSRSYPVLHLSKGRSAIKVQNVNASNSSGANVWCSLLPDIIAGTVLFVGYAPDKPQNLSCETRTFIIITCRWNPGRPTRLSGHRETQYILSERTSRKNVTCSINELNEKEHHCDFPVYTDQQIYSFTLTASNPLGQAESSLFIDINQRVNLETPDKFTVSINSSTNAHLSWYIPGNLTQIRLLCQIEISNSSSEQLNVSMAGAENSNYRATADALRPYTMYTFRVRCSASEHFWKWSEWSKEQKLMTLETSPARGPDIWRERNPVGETLRVFWKPLLRSEANGEIVSHEVSCCLQETMLQAQDVPVPLNSTEINLGGSDCVISVVAKNRGGSSPPSRISSVDLPSDNVKTELAIATGDGIYISWHSDPSVTCGYTVKWCSSGSEPCSVDWETFPSNATDAVLKSAMFQPGVRYNFSVYGCKHNGYQLLQNIVGYMKELPPRVAPRFTVEETSSDSILVKWEDIPVEDCRGFLRGYVLYFAKGEKGTSKPSFMEEGSPELLVKNITDLTKKSLRILDLQGKTSYRLDLRAYTVGGLGPSNDLYVVTKENSMGLIIAILIPVAVAVVLGVVTSILCYRKREWIKETFYPDIPNPENSKALQFQKNICEGNTALKTLEMNPCTPNSVEVVETQSTVPKIEDTEMKSPVVEYEIPEDGSDPETGSHVVVSYCPPIIEEEEISSPPVDESGESSQVIYIDIQSMYQPQVNLEEEPDVNFLTSAGYKPQMQLSVNAMKMESHSPTEDDLDETAGYRPQANTNAWKLDSPDSPISIESNNENGSFGSPCSINSRQFLIPPKDYEDSPSHNNTGWSFTNFFQNKPND
ncbi:leukemia inhibitory factor receptor isoform X2 [Carettochelys insculpta]|uniref:leukemia inhibitory factor receptor isoform X2 n=1 Tax=Carettochelys insculpta TaxID=44489 RepID=UPI003EBAB68E